MVWMKLGSLLCYLLLSLLWLRFTCVLVFSTNCELLEVSNHALFIVGLFQNVLWIGWMLKYFKAGVFI